MEHARVQGGSRGCSDGWRQLHSESSADTSVTARCCWQGDMAGCQSAQGRREREGDWLDEEQRAAEEGCRQC